MKIYLQSSLVQTFKLQNDEGTLLASSAVSAHDPKASFLSFLLPAAAPYRLVVAGSNGADYTLQLYHGAETHEYAGATLVPLGPKNAGYLNGRGLPAGGTPETAVTFAAFADYGSGNANEAEVSTMVKSWNPDFIIAAGDHNYSLDYAIGTPSWTTAVGNFYGSFIKARADHRYPEQTSPIQRYFTAPGNHDSGPDPAHGGELSSYLDYFHSNPGSVPRSCPPECISRGSAITR